MTDRYVYANRGVAIAVLCCLLLPMPLLCADDILVENARHARDLAVTHLLANREGAAWNCHIDISAFFSSACVVMLRTTGFVANDDHRAYEAQLVRHLVNQTNPDGGFFKYPGSPSSKAISRVAVLALRLALGDIEPAHRPANWFVRNEFIDYTLEARIRRTIARAEHFIKRGRVKASLVFKYDHKLFELLLLAHVKPKRLFPPLPLLSPTVAAWMTKPNPLSKAHGNLNIMIRKMMPAISILYRRIGEHGRWSKWLTKSLLAIGPLRRWQERSFADIVTWIRHEQNENGGWFFNAFYTCLNMMAMFEAGVPISDPAMQQGMRYLRTTSFPATDGGLFVEFLNSDMWDTSQGVFSYLQTPGTAASDEAIISSIEHILSWQGSDGSFAFASASRNDPDIDTTAFLLRPLSLALATADEPLAARLRQAIHRGLAYVLARQNPQGGFSGWESTFLKYKPGSLGFVNQTLFDVATPDVTGRVLYTLADLGLTIGDDHVRKTLSFLVKNQHRNGGWWSRWWAGYIVGTDFVLAGLGKAGIRVDSAPPNRDPLLMQSHRALRRALDFIEAHQNGDGGWGETIAADHDDFQGGVGPSTPLHTAYTISALLACGVDAQAPIIERAMQYLLSTMVEPGRWQDDQVTFTVIARAYYYPYSFANYVLPLDALNDYLRALRTR